MGIEETPRLSEEELPLSGDEHGIPPEELDEVLKDDSQELVASTDEGEVLTPNPKRKRSRKTPAPTKTIEEQRKEAGANRHVRQLKPGSRSWSDHRYIS